MTMADDPNTEFEKRCYYDKGDNICKAMERRGSMIITFDDCISVEIQGAIKCLTDAGYCLEAWAKTHKWEIAIFNL